MFTLLLLASWLLVSDPQYGRDVRRMAGVFGHSVFDELRGAPDEAALAQSRHFEEGGIAFDYPAVLRPRLDVGDAGDRSWHFEYGMFTLELSAPGSDIDADAYLGALADVFEGGTRIDAEGPMAGRAAVLCGEERVATRIRIKLIDSWSAMEGFDLPSLDGKPRILLFDDEEVRGAESALARATYVRVLGSLRCDAPAR